MNPANLKARLAPRSPWRAVDLGTRFYRQWWRQSSSLWLIFTALPYALLAGYACVSRSVWPLLLFWWLKPLWERPLLAFFSHALFDDYPSARTLLRRFPAYGLNGLAGQLTGQRFSPARGYLNGVWQLENNRGERAQQRKRVLMRSPGQRAASLTAVVVTLEQCLSVALVVLFITLMPWHFNLEFSVWLSDQGTLHWALGAAAWYLTMTVTEPLYVATSFALYLNERTRQEGWDLQLGLSRIGERRTRLGLTQLALAAAIIAGATALPGPPARAAQAPAPKQQAAQVLASPDFMPMELRSERRLKPSLDQSQNLWSRFLDWLLEHRRSELPRTPTAGPDWLSNVLLVVLVAGLGLLLIRLIRTRRPGAAARRGAHDTVPPVRVAGLDTRPETLPQDLPQAVGEALDDGQVRAALALLLRHALVTLFHRYPIDLPPGATEHDCLERYTRQLGASPPVVYLRAVTNAWTVTAWAHRPVSKERVRDLLARRRQLHARDQMPATGEPPE